MGITIMDTFILSRFVIFIFWFVCFWIGFGFFLLLFIRYGIRLCVLVSLFGWCGIHIFPLLLLFLLLVLLFFVLRSRSRHCYIVISVAVIVDRLSLFNRIRVLHHICIHAVTVLNGCIVCFLIVLIAIGVSVCHRIVLEKQRLWFLARQINDAFDSLLAIATWLTGAVGIVARCSRYRLFRWCR